MSGDMIIFIAMVFVAVFLLSQGIVVPVFGEGRKVRKRLQAKLGEIEKSSQDDAFSSLLREEYMRKLSPLERTFESLPGMDSLAELIEQAGRRIPAYRLVLLSVLTAIFAAFVCWSLTRSFLWTPGAALLGLAIPFFKIHRERRERMDRFEEQLPDAIDSMRRALRAGHPFSSALKLVAEDMSDPLAKEFERTFADINYGNDQRRAMLGLLKRMPSLTVMALVTAVLVQKETGGNLAETLGQIGQVIRSRFRFHRRVKTLSAEGRLSAWILALVPFVLFIVISITTPSYLPVLLDDPIGVKLIGFGAVMGIIGIFWIRRIIRIEV